MNALFSLLVCICLSVLGCTEQGRDIPEWPWNDPQQEDTTSKEEPQKDTIVGKPRYLWIDAAANFRFYANDRSQIETDVKRIKEIGFTDIIVDVRPSEGTVLFDSKIAPHAQKLPAWVDGKYKNVERTADYDILQAFIDYGHGCGLRVNAAMNTFVCGCGGYYGTGNEGPVFTGAIPESWTSVVNTAEGLQTSLELNQGGAVFMSPANDNARSYMLDLIGELAAYDLDGIILDRCRFDDYGLQSDFSDSARTKFEQYIGKSIDNWPSDIFRPGTSSLPLNMSALQKQWMSFRVKTIHDFIESASAKVHSVNADVRFGVYVGAWYKDYYTSGVNWASPKYDCKQSYKWALSDYKDYGFADHCDFMMLGCYAGTDGVYGTGEWTMQGFAKLAKEKLCGDTVCAGGPDIGNGSGFENGGCQGIIPQTIDACINAADGYFCFDLCHIRMYDYWDAFKKGFDDYLKNL